MEGAWDVIIVGARCAGSSIALLLARRGLRVLIVDRASFPSDTLSTHFLWPRGSSYLNRWGLLGDVLNQTPSGSEIGFSRDGIAFVAKTPVASVEGRLREVHGDAAGAVDTCVSVRRLVLDKLLLDAALGAGAKFRPGITVREALIEDGRVVGIAGDGPEGQSIRERARFVVGADGRHSRMAELFRSPRSDERLEATFAYWTYFSGMPIQRAVMEKRGRLAVVIVPTNFSANMTLLFGPSEWFERFARDRENNFYRAISFINPRLGERLRDEGHREEKFYGVADQRAFKRKSGGSGWLLIGDAACIKDQCTAIGMTHAFRDSELATEAILRALSSPGDEEGAQREYSSRREADLRGYYEFVCASAAMAPASEQDMKFMRGLRQDRSSADAFAAMYGDSLRVDEFVAKVKPNVLRGAPDGAEAPAPDGLSLFAS